MLAAASIPRRRGFNLPEMFLGPDDLRWADMIRGPRGRFRESDFIWIAAWGFNYVRLPLSYRWWTDNADPFAIEEEAFAPLDEAVTWADRHGLRLALCLHHAPGYAVNPLPRPDLFDLWRDERARDCFCHHWRTIARRYSGVSPATLEFNLVNEPSACSVAEYERVVQAAVAEIREITPARIIVADGIDAGNTPCPGLAPLGLTQSCRGYWPGELTHHLAWWAGEPASRPEWPMTLPDGTKADQDALRARFQPWRNLAAGGVPVFCGELGAWHRTAHGVFLRWLADLLAVLREFDCGWALWNFRGSFGVLDSTRDDVVYEDWHGCPLDRKLLNLLQAS